jgi:nitroimidazol reductase NimA-like FMN-containing flavoprotein (pyridoxamine 5'-phosphate oxidase superfamily)
VTSKGFDVVGRDECIEMLRDHTFGRVGMRIADEPVILPVFYALVGDEVVFRTDPGTKLIAAVLETRVAFEVDDAAGGWSVLVVGHAHEMRSPSLDTTSARERLDDYWPSGERDRVVRIESEKITGRRLRRSARSG